MPMQSMGWAPARLVTNAQPEGCLAPRNPKQDLPPETLPPELVELARSLHAIEAQRQRLLSKSASQLLAPLASPPRTPERSDGHQLSPKNAPPTVTAGGRAAPYSIVKERVRLRQLRASALESRLPQELILCECGDELNPLDLRLHQQEECPYRQVPCSQPGCRQVFRAKDRRHHEQNECAFVRRTNKWLRQLHDGQTLVTCDACLASDVRQRDLDAHRTYMCPKRLVSCVFASWGCRDRIRLDDCARHEREDCVVGKHRTEVLAASAHVNDKTVCDWCQKCVLKRELLNHQEDECEARERPCPNADCGCPEWVPVGKMEEHVQTVCVVTLERNTLAARAWEKNALTPCKECGEQVRLRALPKHYCETCVSRIVPCKNAQHGCKARLRWRDRHVHEDFLSLNRDRSMLEFTTGGNAYVAVHAETAAVSYDLAPPWTAEFYVWLVDARDEVLDLVAQSMAQMETIVLSTHEVAKWKNSGAECKQKLKELKSLRKNKDSKRTLGDVSTAAKDLADAFDAAESGMAAAQHAVVLARGWIHIYIKEAFRLFKDMSADDHDGVRADIATLAAQMIAEKPALQELPEEEAAALANLEAWARTITSSALSATALAEKQQRIQDQRKYLKKRAELQAQLDALGAPSAENDRLRRRYEREIAKVDQKLALVSDNTPTELLERRGRHIIASSAKNAISLVAGDRRGVYFFRSSLAKGAREVSLDTVLPHNRWNHLVLCASRKEVTVYLNDQLKAIKRGVFELPFAYLGTTSAGGSFQGFIHEVRYWKECRAKDALQRTAHNILHVGSSANKALAAYWTFEEGAGAFIDDMSLTLPRSASYHTRWWLYDTPAIRRRFSDPPTPSLRDKTSCFINQKLKLLAQKARDRETEVVNCRLGCGAEMLVRFLEQHQRTECPHRVVTCPHIGCHDVFQWRNTQQHLEHECERHRYHEELVERYHAKEALQRCLLQCGELIKVRHLDHHYHHDCINRLIKCSREDCGDTIIAGFLAMHLERECTSKSLARERQLVAAGRKRQAERDREKQEARAKSLAAAEREQLLPS
ncbi:TPA: hypothetical protein N0F65_013020 [Lagenidium giganteum]|uniref:TRAF-type domain-containing protein n=1 Tax=Lagenidium giganteum TaxID=4803 RepID=A0AAV2YPQ2_9STRA|nr:TPA: hypothetical protein N0F65_013020 [Lagenidium giganteum]